MISKRAARNSTRRPSQTSTALTVPLRWSQGNLQGQDGLQRAAAPITIAVGVGVVRVVAAALVVDQAAAKADSRLTAGKRTARTKSPGRSLLSNEGRIQI